MKEPRYKLYDSNNDYICKITLKEIIFLWCLDQNTTINQAIEHIKAIDNYHLKGA